LSQARIPAARQRLRVAGRLERRPSASGVVLMAEADLALLWKRWESPKP
jgi:hypothetical protein